MKKIFPVWIATILILLWTINSFACVGRILYVGALDTPEDKVLSQLLVLLINEINSVFDKKFAEEPSEVFRQPG